MRKWKMENRKWARAGRLLAFCGLVLGTASLTAAHFPFPISHFRSSALRLTVARLQSDGAGDWYANPSSIPNLLQAIRERTSLKVEKQEARVRLTDERLWDFPFLHVTGHGNIKLAQTEVSRLREYLLRGGFLH